MRKLIVAINLTLDGYCDHTAMIADDELHDHYAEFMQQVDTDIMGRVTYELMAAYWPAVAANRSGTDAEVAFALRLAEIEKVVVSRTLKDPGWNNARVMSEDIIEEVEELRAETGKKDIAVGGTSIISLLARSSLIDEYNFVIHPVILGNGKRLFTDLEQKLDLTLIETRPFASGAVSVRYACK